MKLTSVGIVFRLNKTFLTELTVIMFKLAVFVSPNRKVLISQSKLNDFLEENSVENVFASQTATMKLNLK